MNLKAGKNTFFGSFQPFLLILYVYSDYSSENNKNIENNKNQTKMIDGYPQFWLSKKQFPNISAK